MNKIAIHQPNFLPHTGFFKKIFLSDIFVILDDVQFSRRSFTQRTLIKYENFAGWLTVPVKKKGKYFQLIKDTMIDDEKNWKKKHLGTFYHYYKRSQYFEEIFSLLEEIYRRDFKFLIDFNLEGITMINKYLGIQGRFIFSSELNIKTSKTERIVEILKRLDGNIYISGEGAKKYIDKDVMEKNNIEIEFYKKIKEYRQTGIGFIPGLSIVDLLFNEGKKSIEWIKE